MTARPVGSQDPLSEPRPVSGVVLVLSSVVLLAILVIGNALVLDAMFGRFYLAWLVVMLGGEVALVAGVLIRWPGLRPVVRWRWLHVVGVLVVGGSFLAHAVYLMPADGMPVSFSVDCSHQHLLVNYVYQHHGFPDDVEYLYIYDDYPVGPSFLAASLAHLLGVLPAQTMYPLVACLVALQVMLAYGIGVELFSRHAASFVLIGLATLMIFMTYSYSVQVFAGNFYSNMMMGDLIVLIASWMVVARRRLHPLTSAGMTMILVLGCLNSYPAWLPFVFVPLVASILLDHRLSMRGRCLVVGILLALTAALTVVTVIDQWDFITWFAPSRDRRLTPGWQSLGGIFLLFAGWGFWVLLRNWRRYSGLALFLAIDAALVVALYGAAAMDMLTPYIPDKTFYFNVFLFIVLTAGGLVWIWDRLAPTGNLPGWLAGVAMLVLGVLIGAGVNERFPPPNKYPITLDEYRVAYQVSREMPNVELTYLVRNNTVFYWIYGCVLNHTHDLAAQNERWRANVPTYANWLQDTSAPQLAFVSDLTRLPPDGQWHVVVRSGSSGVIAKNP